jgi:hypothetical protein
MAKRSRKSSSRGKKDNGEENGMQWLVGNLNQIMADIAMYPPDMGENWKVAREDSKGRLMVEFEPSKSS